MNKYLGTLWRVQFTFLLEPRDLWVGAYVAKRFWETGHLYSRVYVCPLPAIVLMLTIERDPQREADDV